MIKLSNPIGIEKLLQKIKNQLDNEYVKCQIE